VSQREDRLCLSLWSESDILLPQRKFVGSARPNDETAEESPAAALRRCWKSFGSPKVPFTDTAATDSARTARYESECAVLRRAFR
jgi:hypothetical protein